MDEAQPQSNTTRPVPVAETPSEVEAQLWLDALRDEGIRAARVQVGPGGAIGGVIMAHAFIRYRILVDATRIGDARSIIADLDGARALLPVKDDSGSSTTPSILLICLGVAVIGMLVVVLALLSAIT